MSRWSSGVSSATGEVLLGAYVPGSVFELEALGTTYTVSAVDTLSADPVENRMAILEVLGFDPGTVTPSHVDTRELELAVLRFQSVSARPNSTDPLPMRGTLTTGAVAQDPGLLDGETLGVLAATFNVPVRNAAGAIAAAPAPPAPRTIAGRGGRVVVPVAIQRVTRAAGAAVGGTPSIAFPDVDDRGGAATLGMTAGTSVTVQVARLHLDASATLYATTTGPLSTPRTPLVDDQISVTSTGATDGTGTVLVKFRRGASPAASDDTVAELHVSVHARVRVRAAVFLVTRPGGPTGLFDPVAAWPTIADHINAIWSVAGVELVFDPTPRPAPLPGRGELPEAYGASPYRESRVLDYLRQHFNPTDRLPIYLVDEPQIGPSELGNSDPAHVLVARPWPGDTTIVAYAKAIAHEIGHTLDIAHTFGSSIVHIVPEDVWSARRLMHPTLSIATGTFRDDPGYGALSSGAPITGWLITQQPLVEEPFPASLGHPGEISGEHGRSEAQIARSALATRLRSFVAP